MSGFLNVCRESHRKSYLQDLAPLRVAVDVLTGMKHAQSHAVQQDHQHGRSLEPRGEFELRKNGNKWNTTKHKRNNKQTDQKLHCI